MEREAEAKIKAEILEAERLAKAARVQLEKATRAGVDVTKEMKVHMETERKIAKMKTVYIEGK